MSNRNEELVGIVKKFSESGWDVIDSASANWLSNAAGGDIPANVTDELISAVKKADELCGTCGCEFDALYKRALDLLCA